MADFLEQLNDSQRAAVEYCDGPALVIAGAGSGKTRVLTYKIAYLLDRGMNPWNVLALTFTNKAATEMKNRIAALVGEEKAGRLNMGTFHSVFSRILRVEAQLLGYENNFTIYDESDSRSLLKTLVKEMSLDDKLYKPSTVHARISRAKNHLVLPGDYCMNKSLMERDAQQRMPRMAALYAAYCSRLKMANAMDFDDLLTNTYRLLTEHENIRQKYAARYQYILVDEYQDTNAVQQKIVWLLCKDHLRVCAVGDDSQSIYSFRGANIDNILNYQRQLPGTRLFKLEQNYRSTQTIVEAANSLIHHNRNQIPKEVFSRNDEGEKIQYKPAYSDKEEALIVAKDIKRIKRQDDCGYDDFAILYRTNAQSRSFEEEFRRQGIPYRIYGGLSFYQRKEIKDIIAYFRLANPDDEEAIKRIINYPARGIGATTVAKVAACAHDNQVSIWDVIGEAAHYGLNVNKGTLTKLENFRLLISSFIDRSHTLNVYDLGDAIIKEARISEDIMQGKDADDLARQENLEEFLSGMQTFVAERQEEGRMDETFLTDFLQDVALLTDADSDGEKDEPRVSLMTVHAAKGLEFATVFVVGLEENIFPSPIAATTVRELEEERRLLYVAITRAEKHCILTNAQNRFRYGKMEFDNPSRFIEEINPELIEGEGMPSRSSFGGFGRRSSYGSDRSTYGSDRSTGRGSYGSEGGYGGRMPWDSKSVSSQFKADAKPSYTSPKPKPSASAASSSLKPASVVSAASPKPSSVASSLLKPASSSSSSLREGCKIEHQRFGIGEVLKLEGSGENAKATVAFTHAGTKQLLLKFAKYTIIG